MPLRLRLQPLDEAKKTAFQAPFGAWKPIFNRLFTPNQGFTCPLGKPWADFPLHRVQPPTNNCRHPCQVVCSKGKSRLRPYLGQSNKAGLAKSAYRLRPSKDFFDQLAPAQADAVTGMSGRPSINRAVRLLRNMRGEILLCSALPCRGPTDG